MTFLDFEFWVFLAITFAAYYICPKQYRWVSLLLMSILFYAAWGYAAITYVGFTVIVAYLGGLWMTRIYTKGDETIREAERLTLEEKGEQVSEDGLQKKPVLDRAWKNKQKLMIKHRCRSALWICVFAILFILIQTKVVKYIQGQWPDFVFPGMSFGSLQISLNALSVGTHRFSLIVPLGISYYTLSLIGYLADVYWRKEKAERNPFKLFLFAVYFPKILQGPITKYRTTAAELFAEHRFSFDSFCQGLQRFAWGYFKKLVVADRLNIFVQQVFGDNGSYGGSLVVVAAIFGAFQLYCDFSGCMDMALGVSGALGITLDENFNHPFLSKNAAEFWRRWHITLGLWFKDYVYMPLAVSPTLMKFSGEIRKKGMKRFGKAMATIVPLSVVWILTGLWHGTGLNYLMWGIYWGVLIILSSVFEPELKKLSGGLKINTEGGAWQVFRQFRTFLLFVISRLITIPGNLQRTEVFIERIFRCFEPWHLVNGDLYKAGLDRPNFILGMLGIILILWVDQMEERKNTSVVKIVAGQHIVVRWLVFYMVIFSIMIFGVYGPGYDASAFVYMNY